MLNNEQELITLRQDYDALKREITLLQELLLSQTHNGGDGALVDFNNLTGLIKTISVAGELTNATAAKPTTVRDQLFIDTSTATKKLYIYDAVGKVWYSVTIA